MKKLTKNILKITCFFYLLFLIVPVMAQQYYDPYYEPEEDKAQVVIFNVPVPSSSNTSTPIQGLTTEWIFDMGPDHTSCNSSWGRAYSMPSTIYDIGFASPSDNRYFLRDDNDDLDDIDTFIPFLRVNEFDPFNAPYDKNCFPSVMQSFNFTSHNDVYNCDSVKTYKFSQNTSDPQELILGQDNTYYDIYSPHPEQYDADDTLVYFALGNGVNQVTIPNSVYESIHQWENLNINVVNVSPNEVYRVKGVGAFRFSADPCMFINHSKY